MNRRVGVLVGSLRKASFNRMMALELADLARDTLQLEMIEIGNLELYNQDFDKDPPASWVEFRRQLTEVDALLFVTPEYNRSVPGVLKNAIDIASRPYGQNVLDGKPAAVMSVSPGALGGFGANHHLRQSLVFLNVPTMAQPEAYIGQASTLFDNQGKLIQEQTRTFLKGFMQAFAAWIAKNGAEARR